MNNRFYFKMAGQSIRKNKKLYVPFIMAAAGMIALYCIFSFLANHPGISGIRGGDVIKTMLDMGCDIMKVFSVIFLFYTNSFLMKQRKMELGLYCILGMEKKHVAAILSWETLICGFLSMGTGMLFGILFSKACYIILLRMIGNGVQLGFMIPWNAVAGTMAIFVLLFFVLFLYNSSCVRIIRPLELLQSGKKGEKEPKARWLRALVSLIMLGLGYYIAISSGSPITALNKFMLAVLLVMLGTYGLFESGLIAILKYLQKKRRFYYRTRNFVSISGLKYRMKRNGVSLANICILSTAVLIMLSTTVTIYGQIEKRNTGILIFGDWESDRQISEIKIKMEPLLEKYEIKAENIFSGKLANFFCQYENSKFSPHEKKNMNAADLATLQITDAKSHKEMTGEDVTLDVGEMIVYTISGKELQKECYLGETKYTIKENRKGNPYPLESDLAVTDTYLIILKDQNSVNALQKTLREEGDKNEKSVYEYYLQINSEDLGKNETALTTELKPMIKKYGFSINSGAEEKENFMLINGSMLFLGIFLGTVFMVATVLIIYYKQITEGYEDRERFQIMCKVGMSKEEVKSSIRTQVLLVFFFPVLLAGLHVIAASPCLLKILIMFQVQDNSAYILSSLAVFLVFTLIYVCVYAATAKNYYSIVNES